MHKVKVIKGWNKINLQGDERIICYILLLSITIKAVTGQAPGDEDNNCLIAIGQQSLQTNPLIEQSQLREEDGPWIIHNEDNNNNMGE